MTVTSSAQESPAEPAAAVIRSRVLDIVSTVLLACVSVLVGFSAFQASLYSDHASELSAVSSSLLVESLTDVQSNNSGYVVDSVLWALSRMEALTPGSETAVEALRNSVSDDWKDAVDRWREQNGIAPDDELSAPQLDQIYNDTFNAESNATLLAMEQVNAEARDAGRLAARLTGASVVYSASLVILTLAGGIRSGRSRVALVVIGFVLGAAGLVVGAAPVILPQF